MRNPNFLILDEPTNDLDIITLQILEEYLQNFRGCLIIVSHDRYFMDKVVDHILVFHGNGQIKDFPGNYTQYRAYESTNKPQESKPLPIEEKVSPIEGGRKGGWNKGGAARPRKLTFKEKQLMAQLEVDIEQLEREKKEIETALSGGSTSVDEIVRMSKRLPILNEELDTTSMQWLELSELG